MFIGASQAQDDHWIVAFGAAVTEGALKVLHGTAQSARYAAMQPYRRRWAPSHLFAFGAVDGPFQAFGSSSSIYTARKEGVLEALRSPKAL